MVNQPPTVLTCLVTIHGIGFQQPPTDDGVPGYADVLHQQLSRRLGTDLLNDDPHRKRSEPGQAGPVYVQSSWPPGSENLEAGLKRLGSWTTQARRINTDDAPLATHPGITHVALVYSQLESRAPLPGSALETAARTAVSLGHYTTIRGAVQMMLGDAWAMLQKHPDRPADQPASLRVRTDMVPPSQHKFGGLFHRDTGVASPTDGSSGLLATIRHLEDDVAAYVCRNDLRERVRSFVRDALLRLAFRNDVEAIVVNSHSHGTVVAFDVLRELSYAAIPKVKWFVTSGSPLRKYSDLFTWGTEVGCIKSVGGWTNFWDAKDPVADPLAPAADWRPGMYPPAPGMAGLYQGLDADGGVLEPVEITDRQVDNLSNSHGGGLQAHNYWDNDKEVVAELAAILTKINEATLPTGRLVDVDSRRDGAAVTLAEATVPATPAQKV
jgi:hypothetical protein